MDMPMQRVPKHHEVPLLLEEHDVGDAGCNGPQSPLLVNGSQLVKDGVQWHEWSPVMEP